MLIDARGLRCPWPAMRLARAMREGTTEAMIVSDDPVAAGELAALAAERGWAITACDTPIGVGWRVTI